MASTRFFWLSLSCMAVLSPTIPPSRMREFLMPLAARRLSPLGPRFAHVHALQRLDEVRRQRSERGIERRTARDQDVVKVAPRVIRQDAADGRLEAAPDPTALDCAPDPPAHR